MRHVGRVMGMGLILAGWALGVRAASPDPIPPSEPPKEVPAEAPVPSPPPAPPSLPDVEIPPIPPIGQAPPPADPGQQSDTPRPPVFEENKRLFNREGIVVRDDDGRTIFVFDSGDPPMGLLENHWRQYLEDLTRNHKTPIRWRVSGLITQYRGKNYLLLSKVVLVVPEQEGL